MKTAILISGKQGSGKTSLSKQISATLGSRGVFSYPTRLAQPIYEMHDACLAILKANGITHSLIDGSLLQILGTDYGRNTIRPTIWIECLQERAVKFWADYPDGVVIVDDVRFPNELRAFDRPEIAVYRIRLECPEETRKSRIGEKWRSNTAHPSEISLDGIEGWTAGIDTSLIDTPTAATLILNAINL